MASDEELRSAVAEIGRQHRKMGEMARLIGDMLALLEETCDEYWAHDLREIEGRAEGLGMEVGR